MKKYFIYICIIALAAFNALRANAGEINIQNYQDTASPKTVEKYLKAPESKVTKEVLNLLQDEGFMINNINQKYGFISAAKEINLSDKSINFSQEFDTNKVVMFLKWVKICVFEINVNINSESEGTIVKISMKEKLLNTYGNTVYTKDAACYFYESFLNKLNYAVFKDNSN